MPLGSAPKTLYEVNSAIHLPSIGQRLQRDSVYVKDAFSQQHINFVLE